MKIRKKRQFSLVEKFKKKMIENCGTPGDI